MMARKTITISEEASAILASHKRSGESFTDVMLRLLAPKKHGPLSAHFGKWVGTDEEFDRIYADIERHFRSGVSGVESQE